MENGQCRISSFKGNLSIVFEGNEPDELSLFNDQPLIFKLRNDWIGAGRKVSGITKGHFVVIAPNHWERMGHVPVEPEGCVDTGFRAHYFFRDGKESDEEVGGFRECADLLGTSRVELTGEHVHDDSESGELFVSAVPNLKSFTDLVWARVGEEREGGWKGENFKLAEQCLADVLHGRQGRFFIRVYGKDSKLLDSEEFRYSADLREIRVNGEPYSEDALLVPSPTGHPPTEVQFVGVDGGTVHPLLTGDGIHAVVQSGGILIVAPHPQGDDVFCALGSDTGRVDIVIKLPRIWWRIERDGSETGAWRDTPLAMTRQEFQEYTDAGVALRVRLPKRIRSAGVGFGADMDRRYSSQHTEDNTTCAIPLTDFIDYSQIDQRLNKDVSLNVECGGATLNLIRVSADPAPTIVSFMNEPTAVTAGEQATLRWETRNAETDGMVIDPDIGKVETSGSRMVAPLETTTYTLRLTVTGLDDVTKAVTVTVDSPPDGKLIARVRNGHGGWRHGRGFSLGELEAASVTLIDEMRGMMPIDRRRRSTHKINIDTIRRLTDA